MKPPVLLVAFLLELPLCHPLSLELAASADAPVLLQTVRVTARRTVMKAGSSTSEDRAATSVATAVSGISSVSAYLSETGTSARNVCAMAGHARLKPSTISSRKLMAAQTTTATFRRCAGHAINVKPAEKIPKIDSFLFLAIEQRFSFIC